MYFRNAGTYVVLQKTEINCIINTIRRTNSKSSASFKKSYAPVSMSHHFTFRVCHVSFEYFSHGSSVTRKKESKGHVCYFDDWYYTIYVVFTTIFGQSLVIYNKCTLWYFLITIWDHIINICGACVIDEGGVSDVLKWCSNTYRYVNVNELRDLFKYKWNQLVKEHIPYKLRKPKDELPWITQGIKKIDRL